MAVYSFSPFGYEGSLVNVEVDLRRGIPAVDLVGLADGAVKESRERMRSAIINSGFEFPPERVLISLSPADLKKEGAGFDLALALAVLNEKSKIDGGKYAEKDVVVMGELLLNGETKPVRGIYPALATAIEGGIRHAIIPENSDAAPDGITVHKVKSLREAFEILKGLEDAQENPDNGFGKPFNEVDKMEFEFDEVSEEESLNAIKGHNELKYAVAVAVAGRHNILAYGPPGCGKTLILQKMTQLLPRLTDEERASVQRIYSIAGLNNYGQRRERRPFRMPHQTASIEGMCGGGHNCMPGEISLAHNGVLFLDEAAEFKTSVLQMLRVPLECGQITLSRAGRTTVYPARFQLAVAMNPCPCGNYGSEDRVCLCSAKSVEQYWKKFSGPLLARVEIRFNVTDDKSEAIFTLEELRDMISKAWHIQYERQNKLNADLTPDEVQKIKFTKFAKEALDEWEVSDNPSCRARANVIKVARTLQDMRGASPVVDDLAVKRAIKYQTLPEIVETMYQ